MTTFLLVRHGAHPWLDRGVPGRLPGVSLDDAGRRQAQELVARLAGVPIEALYCSPRQRTRETLAPLAAQRKLPIVEEPGVDEVDFGAWSGLGFAQLEAQGEAWQAWVRRRGSARPPGGEAFAGVPLRALAALQRLRAKHPAGQVLVASHGDVIKAVLAHCLRMALDDLELFDIVPASVSMLELGEGWHKVLLVNACGEAGIRLPA